jgi:hypothetical protein
MANKKLPQPRTREEIAQDLHTLRRLIQIADQQIGRAKTDLGTARAGLADIEQELITGVRS